MTAPSVAGLPLVGGHVALDLVNTVEPRLPVTGRHEHLAVPDDVLSWARLVHLVNPAEAEAVAAAWAASPASAGRALVAVRQVREALAAVLSAALAQRDQVTPEPAGARPAGDMTREPAGDVSGELEYLSAAWAAAAARSRLDLAPAGGAAARDLGAADGAVAWLSVGSAPALLIPDRAAHAAVDLLCGTDLTHLAMCPAEEGGCGWLFLDGSRNRSRRWCTMAACGSFAKARRLTERRRVARSATSKTENTSS
jgi:predicted RNA-binding Zn ribbon-like protein